MTSAPRPLSPLVKLALDFGPLLIFFVSNSRFGIFTATGVFMAATLVALILSRWLAGRISPMLWFTGIIVAVFGGATLYFYDETFIKIKPTILYLCFAAILLFGIATKRPFLKLLLGEAFPALDADGWRKLTRNWALFFVALALTNEVVRRLLTTDQWVNFKVWGVTAATFLFALAQSPILTRHAVPPPPPPEA